MRPPVVLLHAFPLDGRLWAEQAKRLAGEFEVLVPDLRGFGKAAEQATGMAEISIDSAADDVALLLKERGIRKAAIGGISRGGYVALAFARKYPEMTTALLLFDTRATPADAQEKQNWFEMAERLRAEGIGFVPGIMKDRLFSARALAEKPELFESVREIILSQDSDAVAAAAIGMATRPDARPGLARLKSGLLAVAGTEDKAFEDMKAIAATVLGSKFVALEGAGHLTVLEQPAFVDETIRAFLRDLTAARP